MPATGGVAEILGEVDMFASRNRSSSDRREQTSKCHFERDIREAAEVSATARRVAAACLRVEAENE